jgi:hypothetical protein
MEQDKLLERVGQIHSGCNKLCQEIIGSQLPVAGNMGVFCQNDKEYSDFDKLREKLTESSENPKQKYFKLIEPIVYPEATYTHLYIRKPDPSEYGKNLGDVDFILEADEYNNLKAQVSSGKINNAEVYERPGWGYVAAK